MDPVAVMLQGSPEQVKAAVAGCINAGIDTTLIAAGCEVPAAAPEENLLVMDQVLYR
jgi:uroporphyrinogen-III decarboxylase